MKIYLVTGGHGDGECYFTWNIKAFLYQKDAENFIAKIENRWKELLEQYKQPWLIPINANEFDPAPEYCYTSDTDYDWEEIELDEDLENNG
jgi:hypothetical protein